MFGTEFLIIEKIAEFFPAFLHADGAEIITCLPVADEQWKFQFIGIQASDGWILGNLEIFRTGKNREFKTVISQRIDTCCGYSNGDREAFDDIV